MPKMTCEQFREFASAVVRNLPDIKPAEAQLLIEEQHRLAVLLSRVFTPPDEMTFEVAIGTWLRKDETLEELESLAIDDIDTILDMWCGPEVWASMTPARLDFRLVRLNREFTGTDAVEELRKRGLRPTSFMETVFFLVQHLNMLVESASSLDHYPNFSLAGMFPMVVLDPSPDDRVPVLTNHPKRGFEAAGLLLGQRFWSNTLYPAVAIPPKKEE